MTNYNKCGTTYILISKEKKLDLVLRMWAQINLKLVIVQIYIEYTEYTINKIKYSLLYFRCQTHTVKHYHRMETVAKEN